MALYSPLKGALKSGDMPAADQHLAGEPQADQRRLPGQGLEVLGES